MPTDFIDVIDSAVKIGLGALIGGIATYANARQSDRHQKLQIFVQHEIATIQVAAEKLEAFFDAWGKFISAMLALSNRNGVYVDGVLSPDDNRRLRALDDALMESTSGRNYAIARLMLLDAGELVASIARTPEVIEEVRDRFYYGDRTWTEIEAVRFEQTYRVRKNEVYELLGRLYERCRTG